MVEVVERVNLGEHLFLLYSGDGESSLKQVLVLLHWLEWIWISKIR